MPEFSVSWLFDEKAKFVFMLFYLIHLLGLYPFCRKLTVTRNYPRWRLIDLLGVVSLCPALLMAGLLSHDEFDYGLMALPLGVGLILLPSFLWEWIVREPINFPLKRGRTTGLDGLIKLMLCLPLIGPFAALCWWAYSIGLRDLYGYVEQENEGWRRYTKYVVLSLIGLWGSVTLIKALIVLWPHFIFYVWRPVIGL